MDEWAVPIDTAESFSQAEAYRHNPSTWVSEKLRGEVGEHFRRNLRVVRDPRKAGVWFLVADINSGRSSRPEVNATVECLKRRIDSWEKDDVISPWLTFAHPIDYDLRAFAKTYGRIINLPASYREPDRAPDLDGGGRCPPPYE